MIGTGRNDEILRLYSTRGWGTQNAYELSFKNETWTISPTVHSDSYFSSPVFADLKGEGVKSLFLGGWKGKGVLVSYYNRGWGELEALAGSRNKGDVLAMKSGKGHNDGIDRLYVSYFQGKGGLVEFSWTRNKFTNFQITNHSVGRFDIGQGRNDGVERVYAFERGGKRLYEFTWNGEAYISKIIYTGSKTSKGSVHVADGRGDKIKRIYFWGDGLHELTYENKNWSLLTLDKKNAERFYITSGSIKKSQKPSVYVSVKRQGLYEYTWNEKKKKFDVDVISGATGGAVIGNGRGDGINRIYVANGSKGFFKKAEVVEIWQKEKE